MRRGTRHLHAIQYLPTKDPTPSDTLATSSPLSKEIPMSRQKRKQKAQEDLAGCIGGLIAIPVMVFIGFQFISAWNQTNTTTPSTVSYTPPSPELIASRKCRQAIKDNYAAIRGFDITRLTSQRITMSNRDDGTFFATIAVPFKTMDARTGKRNRVFWINVECVIDGSSLPVITETDTAGYPE